jgi:hypothetical protein
MYAVGATARLLLLASMLSISNTLWAGHFEKVYASRSGASLTEWGRRYENGEGVVADVDRAIRLYCKAAKLGHADAQYYLGWLYSRGRGVKRDDALAAAWFKKAALQSHPQARNLLQLLRVKPKRQTTCPTNGTTPGPARSHFRPRPAPADLATLVRALAPEFGLNPNLVIAVIQVESNFDPNALSPKNAQGLMQLVPETAERFGVKDAWDPEQNLRGGMAYLRWLLDHFRGDVRLALAGYNAGEGAVERHQGVPPFDETQDYVRKVTAIMSR